MRRSGRGTTRWTVAALLLLALTSGGCATYWRSRVADLKDVVPWSVACGWGIGISAQATPLLNVGLAATPIVSIRWGYDDRVVNGVWRESTSLLPYTLWNDDIEGDPLDPSTGFAPWTAPLMYRWQVFRDAPSGEGNRRQTYEPNHRSWGRHPPVVREQLGAFIVPQDRRWMDFTDLRREQGDVDPIDTLGAPDRATLWESRRAGRPAQRAWDLFEIDVMAAIVGVRLGVRPVEFVDFALGFLWIDLLGDDLPEPTSFEPVEQPLPDAE